MARRKEQAAKRVDVNGGNEMRIRKMKTGKKCPHCGSRNVAKIIYGMPAFSLIKKELEEGKVYIGGCVIRNINVKGTDESVNIDPRYHCNDCEYEFGKAPVLLPSRRKMVESHFDFEGERYLDIVEGIEFSSSMRMLPMWHVTVTRNDDGAHVTVMKQQIGPLGFEEKQLTPDEWRLLLSNLYEKMYLHEWKKSFSNPSVKDGESWHLKIKLSGGRIRNYKGSNAYPPYWKELKSLFDVL